MKFIAGLIVYLTFAMLGITAGLWVLGLDQCRVTAAATCILIGAGWPIAIVLEGSGKRPTK